MGVEVTDIKGNTITIRDCNLCQTSSLGKDFIDFGWTYKGEFVLLMTIAAKEIRSIKPLEILNIREVMRREREQEGILLEEKDGN